MQKNMLYKKELSFSSIHVQITRLGNEYNVLIWGGDKPHIGCTVLSIPRPSLSGDGSVSVTSSVLNVIGHKDEQICRYLAEEIAKEEQTVTVCTGGFHYDNITPAQIQEILEGVKEILKNGDHCLSK